MRNISMKIWLNYARLYEGYHNGTEVEPIPVVWGKAPADVAVVLPMAQHTVQVVNSHIPYTVQLSKVGLVAFTNLFGREMQLYGRIMQNISKVDDKCACCLRSERTVTERMLRKKYVVRIELLVALMIGNYSIRQDPKGNTISLLDFQEHTWTTTAGMWADVFEAAVVMDTLFRLNSPNIFMEMFLKARAVLRKIAQELDEHSDFDFTKSQLCSLCALNRTGTNSAAHSRSRADLTISVATNKTCFFPGHDLRCVW